MAMFRYVKLPGSIENWPNLSTWSSCHHLGNWEHSASPYEAKGWWSLHPGYMVMYKAIIRSYGNPSSCSSFTVGNHSDSNSALEKKSLVTVSSTQYRELWVPFLPFLLLPLLLVEIRVLLVKMARSSLGSDRKLHETLSRNWYTQVPRSQYITMYHNISQYITIYHNISQYITMWHHISWFECWWRPTISLMAAVLFDKFLRLRWLQNPLSLDNPPCCWSTCRDVADLCGCYHWIRCMLAVSLWKPLAVLRTSAGMDVLGICHELSRPIIHQEAHPVINNVL